MSDHEIVAERRQVLGGSDNPKTPARSSSNDDLTINAAAPALRFGLRMDAIAAAAAGNPAGFDVSQPINCLRQASATDGETGRLSARLGPDEWLLIADTGSDTAESLMVRIATELGEAAHTLVDISHRNIAIELTGTAAADVLNTGCPLDLGDQAFPVGTATRTLFAKAEIILCRCENVGQQPLYRVECWRSFGRYMQAYLQESAELIGAAA